MKRTNLLTKKISYLLFSLISFLFFFCFLTEHDLAASGNILWTDTYTFKVLMLSLAGGVLLGIILCQTVYLYMEKQNRDAGRLVDGNATTSKGNVKKLTDVIFKKTDSLTQNKVFMVSFFLILLAWIPSYLAYYPGICSYDSPIQIEQIVKNRFIDHHPIAHTLLIKGAMFLGENMFNSVNAGIGLYSLLQLLFLGAVFAYGVSLLKKYKLSIGWLFFTQVLCMFYPFHLYMSISMTKDTIFTGFFLLLLLSLFEYLLPEKPGTHVTFLILLSTVGMILFRNNGLYAFFVLLIFLLLTTIFSRKKRRIYGKLFLLALAGFAAGIISSNLLFRMTNAEQGDKREMLSMPIQQFARVMLYHGGTGILQEDDNTLEEPEKALINDFILDEAYKEYNAHISDPVKRHTNTYVARYRAKEFIATYLKLFMKYPGDYLNAVLEVNAGYLYPWDVSHAYVNMVEGVRGKGYVQTRWDELTMNESGIYKASKWGSLFERMEKWADENTYLRLPFLKYFFVPGVWLWLYLLLFCFMAVKREFSLCLPLALILGYYGTLFLGPVVQLRYLYPVMSAFPFLALLCHKGRIIETT